MLRLIVFSLLVAGCICAHVVEHHDDETTESLEHEFMELLNQTGSTGKLSMAGLNQVLDNLNEQVGLGVTMKKVGLGVTFY